MNDQAKWFRSAFKTMSDHELNRERISELTGMSQGEFDLLLNSDLPPSSAAHESVARAFNCSLDKFLEIGQAVCQSETVTVAVPQWLIPHLPRLAGLDEKGRKTVVALLEALKAGSEND